MLEDEIAQVRQRVASSVLDHRELVDGYEFIFPDSAEIRQNLATFVDHEAQCCSFFDFAIYPESGHLVCSVQVTRYDVETGKEIILELFE